jgi:hypothetical protein
MGLQHPPWEIDPRRRINAYRGGPIGRADDSRGPTTRRSRENTRLGVEPARQVEDQVDSQPDLQAGPDNLAFLESAQDLHVAAAGQARGHLDRPS